MGGAAAIARRATAEVIPIIAAQKRWVSLPLNPSYEAVNLLIFGVFSMSQVNDLAHSKTAKAEKIHKLYVLRINTFISPASC
jgi:hypothetical protein